MRYPASVKRLIVAVVIIVLAYVGCVGAIVATVNHNTSTKTIVYEKTLMATNKQIANLFINQLLTPKSAACFRAILMKESHMRTGAVNDHSGAKGMGQILASTYRNLGLLHSADPLAQSVAALVYISRHYGGANSTCNAWAYWRSHSSY